MLIFIDETQQRFGVNEVGAVGAVAIPTRLYNRFCRYVYKVKQEELEATDLMSKELKGTTSFAKAAFKRKEMSDEGGYLRAFDRVLDALPEHEVAIMAIWTDAPGLLNLRVENGGLLGSPYVEIIIRSLALMKAHKDQTGQLLFDQMGNREDHRAGCAVQNFLTRTNIKFQASKRILQVPNFTQQSEPRLASCRHRRLRRGPQQQWLRDATGT